MKSLYLEDIKVIDLTVTYKKTKLKGEMKLFKLFIHEVVIQKLVMVKFCTGNIFNFLAYWRVIFLHVI